MFSQGIVSELHRVLAGSDDPHNNMPPSFVAAWIIKT